MSSRQVLPVLPLRGTVIFPGITAPIAAGRPGTLRAIEAALKGDRLVFAVAQRDNTDEPSAEILYGMGVIARIGQVQRGLGGVQLLLQGEQRATALQYNTADGYLNAVVAQAEEMAPLDGHDPGFEALHKETRERAAELGERRGLPEEVVHQVLDAVADPGKFSDLVAGYIELTVPEKQALLETLSVEERLRRVLVHVQRQIGMIEAQEEIKSQVQEELGERQREMFLREQLKTIQKELGEEDSSKEITELREKLAKLELPKLARAEVERELGRLERSGRESMEAQVIRTYLEWIAELPWNTRSDDQLDLSGASKILDEDHYGLKDVKDRILEFLAVRQLRAKQFAEEVQQTGEFPAAKLKAPEERASGSRKRVDDSETDRTITDTREAKARAMAKGPILLFVGPPGVGKTSVAKSIARSLGREYVRVALGGARDEADIRGHRRTYVGAMPGRIIAGMKQAGTKNPVFLLDEVDKLGVSFQGDPSSALLEVLDPAQNDSFTDHYLGVPFDLSEVLFIATANFIQNIPAPLLDRMEVVEFAGYTEREKAEIAKKYLIPRQIEDAGLSEQNIVFEEEALQAVISKYTRESGVRQLEQKIGAVARKVARQVAVSGDSPALRDGVITADEITELLGRPRVRPERLADVNEVGLATGMYYTPMGGDIMFVEASSRRVEHSRSTDGDGANVPGSVSLILTGQLGDVMKESARAAFTYVTNHARELGIPRSRLGAVETHIHVPAGAIPKDGPSAGVAIATALASEMSGRPVRRDVAMTGEVTLRGRVLPIGGVKEKVLGAHRAGITHVVLPKENEADLEDVPEEVRKLLSFHPVETLHEVLDLALVDADAPSPKAADELVGV